MPDGTTHLTFWEALDQYPPCQVRLLAKRSTRELGPQAISDEEVAFDSGITLARVRELSRKIDWQGVSLPEMRQFFTACRFDPTNAKDRARFKQYEYICLKRKTPPFQYLRKHPKWETEFLPLIRLMKQRRNSSTPSALASSALPS